MTRSFSKQKRENEKRTRREREENEKRTREETCKKKSLPSSLVSMAYNQRQLTLSHSIQRVIEIQIPQKDLFHFSHLIWLHWTQIEREREREQMLTRPELGKISMKNINKKERRNVGGALRFVGPLGPDPPDPASVIKKPPVSYLLSNLDRTNEIYWRDLNSFREN